MNVYLAMAGLVYVIVVSLRSVFKRKRRIIHSSGQVNKKIA